jgi:hypothetical protein
MAKSLNVSRDAFFDGLVAHYLKQVDDHGHPSWWSGIRRREQEEELPLRSA